MPGSVSLGRTLVLATVFHAALFAIVRPSTSEASQAGLSEPMKLMWVEPTLEVEPAAAPAPRVHEADDSAREPSAMPAAAPQERSIATAVPMASAIALPESAPSTSGEWSLHITTDHGTSQRSGLTLGDLALDGKNHFLGGREAAPETQPDPDRVARERANRAAGEAMRGALHDQDVALGMGSGGPVVTALEDAVHAGTAPLNSHAVLIAIADASGIVTRVEVESASDDLASFRAIAADVLARLREKRVRIPAAAHGVSMRIEVSSGLSLPSGASGSGVGYAPRSMALTFDPSDIAARPVQVIHAKILGEQLL
jgi:hypothetical protein